MLPELTFENRIIATAGDFKHLILELLDKKKPQELKDFMGWAVASDTLREALKDETVIHSLYEAAKEEILHPAQVAGGPDKTFIRLMWGQQRFLEFLQGDVFVTNHIGGHAWNILTGKQSGGRDAIERLYHDHVNAHAPAFDVDAIAAAAATSGCLDSFAAVLCAALPIHENSAYVDQVEWFDRQSANSTLESLIAFAQKRSFLQPALDDPRLAATVTAQARALLRIGLDAYPDLAVLSLLAAKVPALNTAFKATPGVEAAMEKIVILPPAKSLDDLGILVRRPGAGASAYLTIHDNKEPAQAFSDDLRYAAEAPAHPQGIVRAMKIIALVNAADKKGWPMDEDIAPITRAVADMRFVQNPHHMLFEKFESMLPLHWPLVAAETPKPAAARRSLLTRLAAVGRGGRRDGAQPNG